MCSPLPPIHQGSRRKVRGAEVKVREYPGETALAVLETPFRNPFPDSGLQCRAGLQGRRSTVLSQCLPTHQVPRGVAEQGGTKDSRVSSIRARDLSQHLLCARRGAPPPTPPHGSADRSLASSALCQTKAPRPCGLRGEAPPPIPDPGVAGEGDRSSPGTIPWTPLLYLPGLPPLFALPLWLHRPSKPRAGAIHRSCPSGLPVGSCLSSEPCCSPASPASVLNAGAQTPGQQQAARPSCCEKLREINSGVSPWGRRGHWAIGVGVQPLALLQPLSRFRISGHLCLQGHPEGIWTW